MFSLNYFKNPDDVLLKTTWTYRYKIDAVTNQISRFRSRWCARGDLEDASGIATFSATAAIAIVRQMISLYEVKDCLGAARKSKSRKRARHHRTSLALSATPRDSLALEVKDCLGAARKSKSRKHLNKFWFKKKGWLPTEQPELI